MATMISTRPWPTRPAAWLYGACAVNCSLLGIGERTGNVPLEAMVFEYASLKGSLDGMDPTAVTEIGRVFQRTKWAMKSRR